MVRHECPCQTCAARNRLASQACRQRSIGVTSPFSLASAFGRIARLAKGGRELFLGTAAAQKSAAALFPGQPGGDGCSNPVGSRGHHLTAPLLDSGFSFEARQREWLY